ncbi:MAG TPA: class I SAM-dependent methyltransferase [Anaerolineales bacterium]
MDILFVERDQLMQAARTRLLEVDVVLDIGPGIRPQAFIFPRVHICVEPHLPYIEHMRAMPRIRNDPRFVFLNTTWEAAMAELPDRSVDTVFALDMIEHLEPEDGRRLLQEAERVARRQIAIFTPLGFYPQGCQNPDGTDRWGMDGTSWQVHRSGWLPEDFGPGWEFVACKAYHLVDEHEQPLEKPFGALWAIRTLAGGGLERPGLVIAQSRAKHFLRDKLSPQAYYNLASGFNRLRSRKN